MKAHSGSTGIATPCLISTVDGVWVINATPRPLYSLELSGLLYIEGWVGPRVSVWTDTENLAATHIQSLDSPAFQRVAQPTTLSRSTRDMNIDEVMCRYL